MSNVIAFLEMMGQDATLAHASSEDVVAALADAQVDPSQQAAIVAGSGMQLEAILGVQANVCCVFLPGKKQDDEEEDEPADDDEISLRQSMLSVA
ncbi:MAG TPA: hypothetical protein VGH80_10270 [Xanthomonadaceae bacterium]|jgi:hypothetical protein